MSSCKTQICHASRLYLIWRTMAALRLRCAKYSKTPRSSMSFQMAPWPPGFIMGASGSGSSHCPSSALTTGTIGCSNSLRKTAAYKDTLESLFQFAMLTSSFHGSCRHRLRGHAETSDGEQ